MNIMVVTHGMGFLRNVYLAFEFEPHALLTSDDEGCCQRRAASLRWTTKSDNQTTGPTAARTDCHLLRKFSQEEQGHL